MQSFSTSVHCFDQHRDVNKKSGGAVNYTAKLQNGRLLNVSHEILKPWFPEFREVYLQLWKTLIETSKLNCSFIKLNHLIGQIDSLSDERPYSLFAFSVHIHSDI
jgi:hypothetical protein